ncbi:MAG: hypothetical protein ABIK28_09590 [Planctomycetota bacterium]
MELLILFFLVLGAPDEGALPELSAGQMVYDGDAPIDIKTGHLVPCVVDWNEDGRKDLVVGQYQDAKIRLYLNKGSDAEPRFDGFEFMQAGGKEISLESG